MGILGKDLLDYNRPETHTKIQFGENRTGLRTIRPKCNMVKF